MADVALSGKAIANPAIGDYLIGVDISAANGIRRFSMLDMRGGLYNISDFGAIGDGVIDDTAAIQAAIDAAEAYVAANFTASIVFFPAGKYRVSSSLTVQESAVHLIGQGGGGDDWTPVGSCLVPTENFPNAQYVLSFDWSLKATSLYGNRMKDIAIIKQNDDVFDNPDVRGIHWGVAKGWMEGVHVEGVSGHCLGIQGHSTDFKVYDSRFIGCGFRKSLNSHGIEHVGSSSDLWFSLCKIEGNINGSGLEGIGANNYYDHCHFTGNKNNVNNKISSTESIFSGCNFETPSQHNVNFNTTAGAVSRFRFIGCQFNCNRLDADNTWDCIFIGNDSGGNTASGLIVGNTFAATETFKPRYIINLSDAAAFQVDVGHNTWGSSVFATAAINHASAAVRCLINGLGRNVGDPASTGNWFGFGNDGDRIWNSSASSFHTMAMGAWRTG